ncbi:MAG: hypothetical protein ACLR8Y_01285 [Alistipes indistinctus]
MPPAKRPAWKSSSRKIRPGSGIGSSAASSAAAVFGLNELYGRPFPPGAGPFRNGR